ncbi:nickel import ATP-binding protein NikD [Pseudoroseomonas deserti]|uniref:Nickel import ATP-binding protein NikD n=1 Tax=Teichococcus deserti TaxID=1817963 RepID=A0A1V2H369_9PROT|nr:ATP-binding cassette domain-containing protein [Pseudoroseomonas deserti]ONG52305.1 nickel import ATP-binding protein NikD [Pseudoroseomonas deserti]
MSPRALSLLALHLHDGEHALVRDVSLTIRRGKVLGLVGTSGGGKSLTTLAILDLLPPGVKRVAGLVALDSQPVEPATLRGRIVGLVQQAPRGGFNPLVSIGRHFLETLACDGLRGAPAWEKMQGLLAEVGFERPAEIASLYPSQLSGGMLQRVMLALALARDPLFLLADEPTTDLDLVVQARLLDLLEALVQRRGIGLLLVTHDLSVIARLADTVAVMDQGRIVELQSAHNLFEDPAHPRAQALVAAHRALYA